jgi:hypothetical protein
MNVFTFYGELFGDEIRANGVTYKLTAYSNLDKPMIGWFSVVNDGDKYRLIRCLRESHAEVWKK